MDSIRYSPAKHVADLLDSLKVGAETYIRAQDRAAWILKSGKIQTWLQDRQSHFLVINSNDPSVEGGGQSSVTLFSAKMVQALHEADIGTVLYWSCTRNIHCNIEDLVFDMVGQLLDSADERLSAIAMASLISFDYRDYADVLQLFVALIRAQLASTAVFVVIDSVSCYEDSRRSVGTRQFFDTLNSLADEADNRNPLKVLATSPTRSIFLGTFLDDWNPSVVRRVLIVPQETPTILTGITVCPKLWRASACTISHSDCWIAVHVRLASATMKASAIRAVSMAGLLAK
jgi:hypothetical protein